MGRSIGALVHVLSCSEQQHHGDVTKVLKGLCQAGVWGWYVAKQGVPWFSTRLCESQHGFLSHHSFDDFNRMPAE
eukprot:3483857-Prorocentrum_lima.AAC.1